MSMLLPSEKQNKTKTYIEFLCPENIPIFIYIYSFASKQPLPVAPYTCPDKASYRNGVSAAHRNGSWDLGCIKIYFQVMGKFGN